MRTGLPRAPAWRRLGCALAMAVGVALLLSSEWTPGPSPLLLRTVLLALVGVWVFGLFERWPRRLPRWLARWVLQVVGVGVAMPATTRPDLPPLDAGRCAAVLGRPGPHGRLHAC